MGRHEQTKVIPGPHTTAEWVLDLAMLAAKQVGERDAVHMVSVVVENVYNPEFPESPRFSKITAYPTGSWIIEPYIPGENTPHLQARIWLGRARKQSLRESTGR